MSVLVLIPHRLLGPLPVRFQRTPGVTVGVASPSQTHVLVSAPASGPDGSISPLSFVSSLANEGWRALRKRHPVIQGRRSRSARLGDFEHPAPALQATGRQGAGATRPCCPSPLVPERGSRGNQGHGPSPLRSAIVTAGHSAGGRACEGFPTTRFADRTGRRRSPLRQTNASGRRPSRAGIRRG